MCVHVLLCLCISILWCVKEMYCNFFKYTHDVEDTNLVSERRVILSSGMQNSSTVQTNVINKLLGKGIVPIVCLINIIYWMDVVIRIFFIGSNGTAEDILPLTHNIEPLKPYKISDCPCESHQPYKSVFPGMYLDYI